MLKKTLATGIWLICMPALAVKVTPEGAFSASGKLAMKKGWVPVTCHTTFDGQVTKEGALTVTAVVFEGGNPVCGRIQALSLPWQGQIESPSGLTVGGMHVKVRVPLMGGICGPGPVTLSWTNEDSSAEFEDVSLMPNCALNGVMEAAPGFTIKAAPPKETTQTLSATQSQTP